MTGRARGLAVGSAASWSQPAGRAQETQAGRPSNASSQPTEDKSNARNMVPWEGDVALDFNFWMRHTEIDSIAIAELITCLLENTKSPCLGSALDANSVVVLAVHSIDHAKLFAALPSCSFLSSCSSMPSLLVHRDSVLSYKPSNWFYNDVKSLGSLLFWPLVPRRFLSSAAESASGRMMDVLHENILTVQFEDDFLTLVADEEVRGKIALVLDAVKESCPAAYARCTMLVELMQAANPLSMRCGNCYRNRNSDSGYFICSEQSFVVLWENGDLQQFSEGNARWVLQPQPTISPLAGHPDTDVCNEYDELDSPSLLRLHSIVRKSSIASKWTPPTSAINEEKDSPAQKLSVAELTARVQSLFTTDHSLHALSLPSDLMAMLGYLTATEQSRCLDTASSSWPLLTYTKPPASLLEDGEEPEESATLTLEKEKLASLREKLCKEATAHFYNLHDGALPLDVCAIDCEMCSTKAGLEATRITLVHPVHGTLLDTFIRPARSIVDYHTEFSGVTAAMLEKVTVTLEDVQWALRRLLSDQSLVIGHSLDCDLKALQVVHRNVVDTAALFPHPSGLPYKHALKKLARDYLHVEIQEDDVGHDSAQDALAALALALVKSRLEAQARSGNMAAVKVETMEAEEEAKEKCSRLEDGVAIQERATPLSERQRIQQPHYSLFEHGLHACSALSVAVHSSPLLGGVAAWQADALGYRGDCLVHDAWTSTCERNPLAQGKASKHAHWTQALDRMCEEWSQTCESKRRFVCGSICLHPPTKDGPCATVKDHASYGLRGLVKDKEISLEGSCDADARALEEDQTDGPPPAKRARTESMNNSVADPLAVLDSKLACIYSALPPKTAMLVLTQDSLIPLRLLVAKKIRNKWVAMKKGAQIPIPMQPGREDVKLSTDWNASVDEAALLDCARQAARGCVFIKYKNASGVQR